MKVDGGFTDNGLSVEDTRKEVERLISELESGIGDYCAGRHFENRNVFKMLRYAAFVLMDWEMIDMMLYPVPYGGDDDLEWHVANLKTKTNETKGN